MNKDFVKANFLNTILSPSKILSPDELKSYVKEDVQIQPTDLIKIESNPSFRWPSVKCEVSHYTQSDLEEALNWIKSSSNILISAGAGMSVSSGIKTFETIDIFGESDNNYVNVIQNIRSNKPDKSYIDLLRCVSTKNYFVFTSNVDCFFSLVGFDQERLYECHGNSNMYQCNRNCSKKYYNRLELICNDCGSELRPAIMKYGDKHWNDTFFCEQEERFEKWVKHTKEFVILEIGCGTQTPTVRDYDDLILEQNENVKLVRVNLSESYTENERATSLDMKAEDFIILM